MEGDQTGARVREPRERVGGVDGELVRLLDGRRRLVQEIFAAKSESDGTTIESRHEPWAAPYDGEQALPVEALTGPRGNLRPFAEAMGREVV